MRWLPPCHGGGTPTTDDRFLAYSNAEALANLVNQSRSFMSSIAKAKTAKLSTSIPIWNTHGAFLADDTSTVRTLIDQFPPSTRDLQMQVTKDNIEWARKESRVFLRQSLEVKLVGL